MATARTYSAMLNEYLTNDLMRQEFIKRSYLFEKIEKDNSWKGGTVPVPFQGGQASSLSFGSLTSTANISESEYVRGEITTYKELWGSLVLNSTDLKQHDGKIKESTFLRIMPQELERLMDFAKMQASINLLDGTHIATITDSSDASNGNFVVDKIDRFTLGQKLDIDDGNSSPDEVWVINIVIDTNTVTLATSKGGSAADLSAYTAAQSAKLYLPGAQSNSFLSLRDLLLSAANGGSASIHGQTKTAYPYLQATNISGADVTADNVIEKIFDAGNEHNKKARLGGRPTHVFMSYTHLANAMKSVELQKGGFKVSVTSTKASQYGWTEIKVLSVSGGDLSFVGMQEMPDDLIYGIDMTSMKLLSNGLFRKEISPDGNQFYVVRATTGYSYVTDFCLFGELQVHAPCKNWVLHSIDLSA